MGDVRCRTCVQKMQNAGAHNAEHACGNAEHVLHCGHRRSAFSAHTFCTAHPAPSARMFCISARMFCTVGTGVLHFLHTRSAPHILHLLHACSAFPHACSALWAPAFCIFCTHTLCTAHPPPSA